MATGENLDACRHLISQFPHSEIIGIFCIFELERLNGKKKLEEEGKMVVNYTCLFPLDKLQL